MKFACAVNLDHAVTGSQQRRGQRAARLGSARMNAVCAMLGFSLRPRCKLLLGMIQVSSDRPCKGKSKTPNHLQFGAVNLSSQQNHYRRQAPTSQYNFWV
jgi:hypothetical protein